MKQHRLALLVSGIALLASTYAAAQTKQAVIDGMKNKLKGLGSARNVFRETFDHHVLDEWRVPLNNAKAFIVEQASADAKLNQTIETIITSYNNLGQKIQDAYKQLFGEGAEFSSDLYARYEKQFRTIDQAMTKLEYRLKATKYDEQVLTDVRDILADAADYVRVLAEKTEQDFKHQKHVGHQ